LLMMHLELIAQVGSCILKRASVNVAVAVSYAAGYINECANACRIPYPLSGWMVSIIVIILFQ
jgi:hypothetical protein